MGFLSVGTPLRWADAKKYHAYVREHGIIQFLHIFNRMKDRPEDSFLWGDEIEGMLVLLNKQGKTCKLSLRGHQILSVLETTITAIQKADPKVPFHAHFAPEFGVFMLESTPGFPYSGTTADLIMVEANMRLRRQMIREVLLPNERFVTLGSFPLLGMGEFTVPAQPVTGDAAQSTWLPDAIISPHPRFKTLVANIRERRGSKVDIRLPLYQDTHTAATASDAYQSLLNRTIKPSASASASSSSASSSSFASASASAASSSSSIESKSLQNGHNHHQALDEDSKRKAPVLDHREETVNAQSNRNDPVKLVPRPLPFDPTKEIQMDAMGFGMGCCCLQVTFQARNLREARHLYDHLAVLSPIMLALTASTPFFRGQIADTDVRWSTISQSVDDRPPVEQGWESGGGAGRYHYINKSRYDSIDCYMSTESNFKPSYNDLDVIYHVPSYEMLQRAGVDELLSRHIAHLFIRDPLVIYEENIEIDDQTHTDHFENIQSTNWQTVRFKPPPANSPIGWRVEFRSMEVQATDFENAAFTVFVALLSRAILFFDLNLYIPISKVDENLKRAHSRDSVRSQSFLFRKFIHTGCVGSQSSDYKDDDSFEDMTMAQIMCGKPGFPGLITIVRSYLDIIKCEPGTDTRKAVDNYLDFISKRATGELLTLAQWYRLFVSLHPSYGHDSTLTEDIVHDLVDTLEAINNGTVQAPQLFGNHFNPLSSLPATVDPAKPLVTSCFQLDLQANCGCQSMAALLRKSS